ncbi:hypothetical protein [Proteiniclasticum ruminis]|uniref:DUF4179 domain-containing protein n=1 Tax=Proteiniclasticum ruminis TaxID=398199 RepID=A0A1G8HDC4_9CLOT|nr:hypothetical protein [Proteiniclasticum ruminis]SDI04599.1 hypothetical protein SAMN05421804_101547 [Proteiniclasticum ruminis]
MNPFDEKVRSCLEDEIMEPDTLHTLEERVLARYRGTRRKKAAQLFLMMSLLFSGLLFYTANTESVFADKLRSVPILKEFLTAMDISPAEEKSVEELGILSESGKYDVRLQYALSEDKRVFLYFQFPEEVVLRENDHLEIELLDVYDQVTKKDYSMTFMKNLNPGMPPSNNGYVVIQGFIPAGMDLSFPEKLHIAFRANVARNVSYDHWGKRSAEDEPLGEYRFDVELQKMEKRILERVGKKVLIDGNTLVIDQLERGLKTLDIVVSQPKNNNDIITEISGYMRDGKTKKIIDEDITVSYSTETGEIHALYLNGEEIPEGGEVEIVLEEAILLPKDQQYITIDMQKKEMIHPIPGISLEMASAGKRSALTFITESNLHPFDTYKTSASAEEKRLPHPSVQTIGENRTKWSYVIDENLSDEVVLRRARESGRKAVFETPIVIELKVPSANSFTPIP